MATKKLKNTAKKAVKKSLVITKKILKKNKHIRRVGAGMKNALFPGLSQSHHNVYDFRKYYPNVEEYYQQINGYKLLKHQPLISIVMPTYNTPIKYLTECIDSVLVQSYPNWELCIADDASSDKEVVETIKKYAKKEPRIKLVERKQNGHISLASNSAIEIASGEFIALLDHDDLLWPNALYEVVKVINAHPKADLIYTDEDKVNSKGDIHSYPFFKPQWSPEFLESCNYITHFSTIRANLVDTVGGFRKGYEGAQDWDLLVRVTEVTDAIYHIPKVLYSWRIHEASTAHNTDAKPYVYEAQRKLLEDHLGRTKLPGVVRQGIIKQHSSIQYDLFEQALVSIIIYGEKLDETKRCLQSILNNTTYTACEITVITSKKSERGLLRYLQALSSTVDHLTHHAYQGAASSPVDMYNFGISKAKGKYVVWLRSSLQIATKSWVELMLADVQRDGVGAVGIKTVDRTHAMFIQAGVGMGIHNFCENLLRGISLEDIHYMRGLYGQSRRNTSALHGCLMVKKEVFKQIGRLPVEFPGLEDIDFCLQLHERGYRNIYNPHVEAIDFKSSEREFLEQSVDATTRAAFRQKWRKYVKNDPYLNPNFSRTGPHLDIK